MIILYSSQEAIAVGRSFASIRGYHLDGNKEMVAMGCMNIAGSLTSCYVATGELFLWLFFTFLSVILIVYTLIMHISNQPNISLLIMLK